MRVGSLCALGVGLGLVVATSGASADPSSGVSLAAPGACAQPDPQLVTQTIGAMPAGVAGRPSDDFVPLDLDALARSGSRQGPLRALLGDALALGTAPALPPVSAGPVALPSVDPPTLLDPVPLPGTELPLDVEL